MSLVALLIGSHDNPNHNPNCGCMCATAYWYYGHKLYTCT